MGKSLLDMTREEFAEWLRTCSIEEIKGILIEGKARLNTFFIYSCICNELQEYINNAVEEEILCDYKVLALGEEKKGIYAKYLTQGRTPLSTFNRDLNSKKYIINRNGDQVIKGTLRDLLKEKETIQEVIDYIQEMEGTNFYKDFVDHVKLIVKPKNKKEDGIMPKSDENSKEKSLFENIKGLIDNGNKQIILTGPPGTGKTHVAREIQKSCSEMSKNFVQFHPSYDYVDFVEGIRPTESDGQMVFRKMDGIFKRFCREVIQKGDKNEKYVFLIDEINRADLSKVFGELLFALEEDKRGEKNRIQTQYSQLPNAYEVDENGEVKRIEDDVFAEGFYVPENVIILATMNDIDRSVESIDFAFRRRFKWIEVKVDEDSLKEAFENMEITDTTDIPRIINAILQLNKYILDEGKKYLLDENYYISQGYFSNLSKYENVEDLLESVWEYRIKNTIEEYVRGEDGASDFVDNATKAFKAIEQSTKGSK